MDHPRWNARGDYFENCNCAVLCPCLLSKARAQPTEGHCGVPLAFHLEEGRYADTRLDDLNVVIVFFTPGPMGEGNWTFAAYLDERADVVQRTALEAIFTGAAGGPLGRIRRLITRNLGVKSLPISYSIDGNTRRVTIPDVLEMNVEGITGANRTEPAWLDNVQHPVNSRLAAAQGTATTYRDHGFTWDNTGKNGHYAPFDWKGP